MQSIIKLAIVGSVVISSLWANGPDNLKQWELKENNFNPNDYEMVYTLQLQELYYAFNKQTNDVLVMKLQKALKQLEQSGTKNEIIAKNK